MSRFSLDADTAARFARIALGHVRQEYPHKLDHVLGSDADALPPHVLHPIFFGSFDWHSCVHGWWTLLTLRRLFLGVFVFSPRRGIQHRGVQMLRFEARIQLWFIADETLAEAGHRRGERHHRQTAHQVVEDVEVDHQFRLR